MLLWCFNGQGLGTGYVVGFVLGSDGMLTETVRAPVDVFILPMAAGLGGAGGPVIVADGMAGTFRVDPVTRATTRRRWSGCRWTWRAVRPTP